MTAIVLLARSAIRRRWRSILAISLLVGLVGTAVLAASAGARRTATALARFTDYSRSADVELTVGDASAAQLRAFERSGGVAAVAELHQITLLQGDEFPPAAAALDGRFGTIVDRPRVVTGRLPKLSAPDEITIGEALAAQRHLKVGDRLTYESYSRAQVALFRTNVDAGPPAGPRVSLNVVGIVRRPLDLGARAPRAASWFRRPPSSRNTQTSAASAGRSCASEPAMAPRTCRESSPPRAASSEHHRSSTFRVSASRPKARATRSPFSPSRSGCSPRSRGSRVSSPSASSSAARSGASRAIRVCSARSGSRAGSGRPPRAPSRSPSRSAARPSPWSGRRSRLHSCPWEWRARRSPNRASGWTGSSSGLGLLLVLAFVLVVAAIAAARLAHVRRVPHARPTPNAPLSSPAPRRAPASRRRRRRVCAWHSSPGAAKRRYRCAPRSSAPRSACSACSPRSPSRPA